MADVVIVPIDDRPCTREFPAAIARIGGWRAAIPPVELLGSLNRAADFHQLLAWLEREAAAEDVRGVVLSLDTIAYGGTTAARRTTDEFALVKERLEAVKKLKERYPELPLLAFSVIMRISNSDSNEEEKTYWRDFGRQIYGYSFASDRFRRTGQGDDQEINRLRNSIPEEVMADYLAGRARNHRVNTQLVAWAASGVLDDLVLTQDDTSSFGFNVQERRELQASVAARNLGDRVLIYPGADEVASTLVARLLNRQYGRRPHVYVRYSRSRGGACTTRYEDRPLDELIDLHLQAAGAVRVGCPQEAEALLFVHVPAGTQWDLWLEGACENGRQLDNEVTKFIADMGECLARGRVVALADVAYANGADDVFMRQVAAALPLNRLSAYAAWNTAGNTLGTVIAHLSARLAALNEVLPDPAAAERAHAHFLVERYLDDWLYQSRVRASLKQQANGAETLAVGARELAREASSLFLGSLQGRDIDGWRFHDLSTPRFSQPWGRLFEAGIGFQLEMVKAR